MTQFQPALAISSLTILGGLVVLVVGCVLSRCLLTPALELRTVTGKIQASLVLDQRQLAGLLSSGVLDGEQDAWLFKWLGETSERYRRQASELSERAYAVPCYRIAVWLGLPSRERVRRAAATLGKLGLTLSSASDEQGQHDAARRAILVDLGFQETRFPRSTSASPSRPRASAKPGSRRHALPPPTHRHRAVVASVAPSRMAVAL
jgi:hypothetical protein